MFNIKKKSKWKNLVKRAVIYAGAVGFLNYFGLPISYYINTRSTRKHIKNERIQQVCRTDLYLDDIVAGTDIKNCNVLPLVKAAHAITTRYLTYRTINSEETKKALEEGIGDCTYFSIFTYSNFLYLADKFGRPELKDKVKLCGGFAGKEGHAWLQVYCFDKWLNYETTFEGIRENLYFWDLNAEFPNYAVLRDDGYYSFNHTQFKNGKLVNHLNFLGSFESGMTSLKFWLNR